MGPIGVQEMIVIFLVALVLFGPKKLPELGRTIGKAITEFRRASNDLKSTFEREMQSLERENDSLREVAHTLDADIRNHSDFDTHAYYEAPAYGAEPYDSTANHPSTVSASEVPGAESQRTAETAASQHAAEAVEGTVPRTETPHTEAAGELAAKIEPPQPVAETPQHS
jgi:TatA/E family protein of Tat protein translocase